MTVSTDHLTVAAEPEVISSNETINSCMAAFGACKRYPSRLEFSTTRGANCSLNYFATPILVVPDLGDE